MSLTFLDEIAADVKGEIFFLIPIVFIKEFVKLKNKKKKESSLAKFYKELYIWPVNVFGKRQDDKFEVSLRRRVEQSCRALCVLTPHGFMMREILLTFSSPAG